MIGVSTMLIKKVTHIRLSIVLANNQMSIKTILIKITKRGVIIIFLIFKIQFGKYNKKNGNAQKIDDISRI